MLYKEMLNEDPRDYIDDPHLTGYCSWCGRRTTSVTRDYGIGSYEFWGAPGVDHQYVEESSCCDAPVIECQLPCHAKCQHFLDEIMDGEYIRCDLNIPEEAVDGKECNSFEPSE